MRLVRYEKRSQRQSKVPFGRSMEDLRYTSRVEHSPKVAFFMGYGDQPPVAVSGGNFGYEDRRGFLGRGVSRRPRREGNNAGQSCNCNQQESESFHRDASFQNAYAPDCTHNFPRERSGGTRHPRRFRWAERVTLH